MELGFEPKQSSSRVHTFNDCAIDCVSEIDPGEYSRGRFSRMVEYKPDCKRGEYFRKYICATFSQELGVNVGFHQMLSLYLIRWLYGFCFFSLLYGNDTDFQIKPALHPWDKPHLVLMYLLSFLYIVEFSLLKFWFTYLCQFPRQLLACIFLFLYVWFWYQGNSDLRMSWEVFQFFLKKEFV